MEVPEKFGLFSCSLLHLLDRVSSAEVCRSCKSTQLFVFFLFLCTNKIYSLNARTLTSSGSHFGSHKSDITLLLITLHFSAQCALLRLHIYVTKDYFEPLTVLSISLRDIITLFINVFAYLSFTLVQRWKKREKKPNNLRIEVKKTFFLFRYLNSMTYIYMAFYNLIYTVV